MASKTLLLDLPNELFLYIFEYLRSIDLLKAFSDLNSSRLKALIQPFITRLDISEEVQPWVETDLRKAIAEYNIVGLCVRMEQLPIISPLFPSLSLRSMQVINASILEEVICQLPRDLKELSVFDYCDADDRFDWLFQSDSQLERLVLKGQAIYLQEPMVNHTHLTHLSITLEGIAAVFELITHLPNLRKLQVTSHSEECISQPAPRTEGVHRCNQLRSVTFTGWIKYFEHFETFFATFGSTIEYLSLNIQVMFRTIDGQRLEKHLLEKMPRLSTFHFIIFSPWVDGESIEIETFQTFTWQQFNPVVYWYDKYANQHTIFTLPYTSSRFENLSNDFTTGCVSNRPVSISFKRVRTLSLISTSPFSLETFRLISDAFPNITTVEAECCMQHPLDESEEHDNGRSMSDELLLDNDIQIISVTELSLGKWSDDDDYNTFRRFIHLFPNIIRLKLHLQQPLLNDLLKRKHEDGLMETVLGRIEQVTLFSCDEDRMSSDDAVRRLFPNVTNIIGADTG